MKYKVFYSFQEFEEERLDDESVEMELEDAAALLEKMTSDGDFLGLIDAENNTFQLMYDEEGDVFWVEIPDPEKQGSYGAVYLRDEVKPLLGAVGPLFRVEDYPIFEFEEWGPDEDDEDGEEE